MTKTDRFCTISSVDGIEFRVVADAKDEEIERLRSRDEILMRIREDLRVENKRLREGIKSLGSALIKLRIKLQNEPKAADEMER